MARYVNSRAADTAILMELDFEASCETRECQNPAQRAFRHPDQALHLVCQPCATDIDKRLQIVNAASEAGKRLRLWCAICHTRDLTAQEVSVTNM